MSIVNQIISKENLKYDLVIFGQFDLDASGNNGEEYTSKECIKEGFKNDLEYWSELAQEKYNKNNDLEEAIETFMEKFATQWTSYSKHVQYAINKEVSNDGFLLTFVF